MKQTDRILNHLQTRGSITQAEASELYGCSRLGARIYDLRHAGHHIVREMESGRNRYGDRTVYARYRMVTP